MRYGYAIKTGGAPEISGALADGIMAGVKQAHRSDAVRRVAMMRHTPAEWAKMTEEARVFYGGRRYTPRWAEALLVGYALICYGVAMAYRLLGRVTEGSVWRADEPDIHHHDRNRAGAAAGGRDRADRDRAGGMRGGERQWRHCMS
ncbi:MAG: hypothetical protein II008_01435 [Oscillospiraceae bacterium]|nr:hypothetical protein [Oscillospiraceae bacterium]